MSKPFKLLSFSLLLNIIYISIFLRNPSTPVFIYGNSKIIIFSLSLFILFLISKIFNKNYQSLNFFKDLSIYHLFSSIIIAGLISILFWSLFPTIIDRSLSVNVLGTLYKAQSSLNIDQINKSLYENYMDGEYQANKRIEEQLRVGNIYRVNQNYFLTKKGEAWAKFNIYLANFFGLDKKSAIP